MIELVKGNYGHTITMNITNDNGTSLNLSGSSVKLNVVHQSGYRTNYDVPVTNASGGQAVFVVPAAFTRQVGKYDGTVDVITPTSKITLDDIIEFNIE